MSKNSMRRILLVHNFYGSTAPSGENNVFEQERDLLLSKGHDVLCYNRYSDEVRNSGVKGTVKGGLVTPWNMKTTKDLHEIVQKFRPSVAHVHNTFPLISPSIFAALSSTKTVLTLHNYRYFCVNGIPMREGKYCTKCFDRGNALPALIHGCYRQSRIASLPLIGAATILKVTKLLQRTVDGYIAFSNFQKNILIQQGLNEHKIFLKPNACEAGAKYADYNNRTNTVLFVGRLSEEKGVQDLIEAWKRLNHPDYRLEIVGDGSQYERFARLADGVKNITFLGKLCPNDTQLKISKSSLLVLPSRCYEGFPMVLSEAFASGTPVAVSNLGPLPEIAQNAQGAVFNHSDPDSLKDLLSDLLKDRDRLRAMSASGRKYFSRELTFDKNYKRLMEVYNAV